MTTLGSNNNSKTLTSEDIHQPKYNRIERSRSPPSESKFALDMNKVTFTEETIS